MYDRNTTAFLGMIAKSEGTYFIGECGYNVIVGSTRTQPLLFKSYADHPRMRIMVRKDDPRTPQNEELVSTAAGRYQILARYFDSYKKSLNLPDFGPQSQDAIAVQMIREQKALDDVIMGHVELAVGKCSNIWASLPGAGYGQHENAIVKCRQWFIECGGGPA
jgi:muramidase (phage lysozyme)